MFRVVSFFALLTLVTTWSYTYGVDCWLKCRTVFAYMDDRGVTRSWQEKATGFAPISHAPLDELWSQNPETLPRINSTTIIKEWIANGYYTCPKDANQLYPLPEEMTYSGGVRFNNLEYSKQKCSSGT